MLAINRQGNESKLNTVATVYMHHFDFAQSVKWDLRPSAAT